MSRRIVHSSRRLFFAGVFVLVAGCAAQRAAVAPVPPDSPDAAFSSMVSRLKAGDSSVDFTALRMAYTRTASFDPYGAMISDDRAGMMAAANAGDYGRAAALADAVLEKNFVDAGAHIVSMLAHRELGNTDRERFHRFIAEGLIRSISGSDPEQGRKPGSPYVVISVREEYDFLQARGLKPERQSLVRCNDRPCDAMDVTDRKSGRRTTLFFDVSIPMEELQKGIGSGVE